MKRRAIAQNQSQKNAPSPSRPVHHGMMADDHFPRRNGLPSGPSIGETVTISECYSENALLGAVWVKAPSLKEIKPLLDPEKTENGTVIFLPRRSSLPAITKECAPNHDVTHNQKRYNHRGYVPLCC